MKLAYADPPYPGQARRHYSDQPICKEVNHPLLIAHLDTYDGWALSTGSVHLRQVLPLCPDKVRVAAWVKPFAAMKKGVVPCASWEPVVLKLTSRKRSFGRHTDAGYGPMLGLPHDWHSAMPPIFNGSKRSAVKGEKPLSFCLWVLDMLGFQPGDELDDLFPGSGIMAKAVDLYGRQRRLFPDLTTTHA